MKFWLDGEAVDDPVAPDQYTRWTALCHLHTDNLKATDGPATRAKAAHQRCPLSRQHAFTCCRTPTLSS